VKRLALVARLKTPAGERQQLGLQMTGDDVELVCAGRDAHAQRAATHRVDRVAVIIDLDGRERLGELADLRDVAQRQPREHTDADRVMLLEHRRGLNLPITVESVDEIRERLRVADLLDGEDVGCNSVNYAGERRKLGLVRRVVAGPEFRSRAKEVLQIPRADNHHRTAPSLAGECAGRSPGAGDRRMPNAARRR